MLRSKGYDISADGYFGKQTEEAVRAFQKENSLTVDGIVGQKTWAALLPASERKPVDVALPNVGNTVKITNYNTGSYMEFKNIPTDKTIKLRIWNNEKIMLPSYTSYDYDNFNGGWLELEKGINTIQIDGACVMDMQLQFPIMI
jgi:peptidoglycan hydrolase-like protein with peptidoglycan-binding domain